MRRVLIVDDEEHVLYSFKKGLANSDLELVTAECGTKALDLAEEHELDAVLLDVRLPDMSGLDVFDRLHDSHPRLPVVVITAHGTTDTAIDAMKRGAFDYLVKPIDIHHLRDVVSRALEVRRLQDEVADIHGAGGAAYDADCIVGRSAAMQRVYKYIGRVASEDVTVLILGESGTGKELVAKSIYNHSRRAKQPFLAINCAALPEPLLESELFGHERGAFTGADRQRIGKFEQAQGGTLFLDELGDMSPATQAKLLRVLQDGRFERLGGNATIATDVRVVAATNQDLERKIEAGEFRSDLLYRLNAFTIQLPPLRDRLEDLPMLVESFLRQANRQASNRQSRLSADAMDLLLGHHWPGNVRELQSAIKYAVVHCMGEVITPDSLPEYLQVSGSETQVESGADELPGVDQFVRRRLRAGESDIYRSLIEEVDRIAIYETLRQVAGNQVRASQRLGMSRTTLRAKINALGLNEDVD